MIFDRKMSMTMTIVREMIRRVEFSSTENLDLVNLMNLKNFVKNFAVGELHRSRHRALLGTVHDRRTRSSVCATFSEWKASASILPA